MSAGQSVIRSLLFLLVSSRTISIHTCSSNNHLAVYEANACCFTGFTVCERTLYHKETQNKSSREVYSTVVVQSGLNKPGNKLYF